MRKTKKISLKKYRYFKEKLFTWAQQFEVFVWLDSNRYPQKNYSYDAVLAVGTQRILQGNTTGAFDALKKFRQATSDYIFGFLAYDLKNNIESLQSENFDGLRFPDIYFFQPKKLFFINDDTLEIKYLESCKDEIQPDLKNIETIEDDLLKNLEKTEQRSVKIKKRITKKRYLEQINKIKAHIQRGDIYEVNFCQEFYADNAIINPLLVYNKLNQISHPPFASYIKLKDKYVISASPERFVRKEGNKIISQPIKGTAKRLSDKKADKALAKALAKDPKERSENIMIVDLVRNDLAKIAKKGSVKVEELCKVYSFDQVHQLISTIRAYVKEHIDAVDIIKNLFPMGSMTGAPKLSAMQIIENMEATKRGVYSGTIGYFTPEGNFDFSVVIRSILYNKTDAYLSYSVGGAITAKSDPEREYDECLVKAIAMKKALKD
ncbi:MAG: aminodeoxychorismate synthase, component I [Flavobacteriales bacterium]|nr:MAG: aminodeoxychorismate synthase, component I [Flavobacteriales bacterium]